MAEINSEVVSLIGGVAPSSVRSYLQLNTPGLFARMDRAQYVLQDLAQLPSPARREASNDSITHGNASLYRGDCMTWLSDQPANSYHAVVTDPPYGLIEYSDFEQEKLRAGKGGIWRIPPSFDGAKRSPLPRFTVLKRADLDALEVFFSLDPTPATSTCSGRKCCGRKQSLTVLSGIWRTCQSRIGKARRDCPTGHDHARW